MRWFSAAVMIYMLIGILWWGKLLLDKNSGYYSLRLEDTSLTSMDREHINNEWTRQQWMIYGEGIVLGLAMLAGLWIINRSAIRQISAARQQSNFLLSVSHELKSPIAAIKLAMQTLQRSGLNETVKLKITLNALKDADRLESMVQNILLSTSIEEKKLELISESVDLDALIRSIITAFHNDANNIRLINQDETTKRILGDQSYLYLAIKNVVDNALKHSRQGTQVTIDLSSTNTYHLIKIHNQGIPIPSTEQLKVFQKFYRLPLTKDAYRQGTGLGLYLSKEIILAHGGRIQLDSTCTDGVRVHIQLPKN